MSHFESDSLTIHPREISNDILPQIVRKSNLVEKVVFVDGQPGCGKTMLSPIIASLDRVELLTYAYEIEFFCVLYFFKKIHLDAVQTLIRMMTDLRLYNTMMCRETNFRPSDLSSIFKDIDPLAYMGRLLKKGDAVIPDRIQQERPILHLTTHDLVTYSDPIFSALGKKAVFIEVVRHPLYMVKQQMLNMERLVGDARDFYIYFRYQDKSFPYYTHGIEELFLKSNSMERAIYVIERMTQLTKEARERLRKKYNAQILTIPFEHFVLNPWPFLQEIEKLLETKITTVARKMMKRQKVPRGMISQGRDAPIYRRCGWNPPSIYSNEKKELETRRDFVVNNASAEALQMLDRLSRQYEEQCPVFTAR